MFQKKSKRSRQERVAPVAVIRIEFAARATTGLAVGRRSRLVEMERGGFRADQEQANRRAKMGWGSFFAKLEQVLARGP